MTSRGDGSAESGGTSGAAPRIEALAVLPVFFKLAGRRAIVGGGSAPAAWKAELLAAAGADVLVVSPSMGSEMVQLGAALADRVTLLARDWSAADLEGAAIAVGAFEGEDGVAFRNAARCAGVPVNIIDVPSLCDFQFGTIVERSPLVIGISTDGAAPVLGQALRARIEALMPERMGEWARAAKHWRTDPRLRSLDFRARRRFWESFADLALQDGARAPTEADRQTCLAAAEAAQAESPGRLLLVGAGPGDPDLVTLGAVRALQSADDIVYADDIAPATLGLGRREAVRVRAEKGYEFTTATALYAAGRTVAWVGPGDAGTCPVWIERRRLCSLHGAASQSIPGVRCATCPDGCAAG